MFKTAYHLRFDERLESVEFGRIFLLMNKFDLSERALSNDFDSGIVIGTVLRAKEAQELGLTLA